MILKYSGTFYSNFHGIPQEQIQRRQGSPHRKFSSDLHTQLSCLYTAQTCRNFLSDGQCKAGF